MEAIHQDKKGLEARVGIEPALLMENTEVIDNTMSKSRKKAIKAHYVSRFSHSIMRVFAFPDLQKRPCDPGLSHGTLFPADLPRLPSLLQVLMGFAMGTRQAELSVLE